MEYIWIRYRYDIVNHIGFEDDHVALTDLCPDPARSAQSFGWTARAASFSAGELAKRQRTLSWTITETIVHLVSWRSKMRPRRCQPIVIVAMQNHKDLLGTHDVASSQAYPCMYCAQFFPSNDISLAS